MSCAVSFLPFSFVFPFLPFGEGGRGGAGQWKGGRGVLFPPERLANRCAYEYLCLRSAPCMIAVCLPISEGKGMFVIAAWLSTWVEEEGGAFGNQGRRGYCSYNPSTAAAVMQELPALHPSTPHVFDQSNERLFESFNICSAICAEIYHQDRSFI